MQLASPVRLAQPQPAMAPMAARPARAMPGAIALRSRSQLTPGRPAAAAGRRRQLVARAAPVPDDPHLQQADEEEGSSGDEEFTTVAGAVEVVDETEAQVGAAAGGWRRSNALPSLP